MRARLRAPLSSQNGQRVAEPQQRPAPVGGLDFRAPKDGMRPQDAQLLDNWFPDFGSVITRPGSITHCDTGTGKPIRALIEYEAGGVHRELAASNGALFDVTGSSARLLGSNFTSDSWVGASIGNRLIMCNGCNTALDFDGYSLAANGFTGVDTRELSYIHVHQRRAYFVQRQSKTFWYGGPNTVAGALTAFNLGLVGNFGGDLLVLFSLSREAANGSQSYLVALFTSGEGVIYSGTDPGDAANFGLVGTFKIGRPLSKYSLFDQGSDVVILTERGFESVSVSLPKGDLVTREQLISAKIQPEISKAILRFGFNEDWQVRAWPSGQMMIFNVPSADGRANSQFVQNINTKAWCSFSGLNVSCLGRYGQSILLGTLDGRVIVLDPSVASDDDKSILCDAITAWDQLGVRGFIKSHKLQRLFFESEFMPPVHVSLGCDYQEPPIGDAVEIGNNSSASEWDAAFWDEAEWGSQNTSHQGFVKCGGQGISSALRVTLRTSAERVAWNTVSYIAEVGGPI